MVSEVLAAWILAFFVLVAGLSLLAFHERGVRDGVVAPGWRVSPMADRDQSDDPECRRGVMSCFDLPEQVGSTDPIRARSAGGVGW